MNRHQRGMSVTGLATFCLLTGCIAVPIGVGEEEPFQETELGFLKTGETTKEEVAREMSNLLGDSEDLSGETATRLKTYRDGKTWLYGQSRDEARVFAMVFVGVAGDAGVIGDVDYRFLLLDFDSNKVLKNYKILRSGGGCSDDGVCAQTTANGLEYELLATPAEENEALAGAPTEEQCSIFLFSNLKDPKTTLAVNLNGQKVGLFFNDDEQYFLLKPDAGHHELRSKYAPRAGDKYVDGEAFVHAL